MALKKKSLEKRRYKTSKTGRWPEMDGPIELSMTKTLYGPEISKHSRVFSCQIDDVHACVRRVSIVCLPVLPL